MGSGYLTGWIRRFVEEWAEEWKFVNLANMRTSSISKGLVNVGMVMGRITRSWLSMYLTSWEIVISEITRTQATSSSHRSFSLVFDQENWISVQARVRWEYCRYEYWTEHGLIYVWYQHEVYLVDFRPSTLRVGKGDPTVTLPKVGEYYARFIGQGVNAGDPHLAVALSDITKNFMNTITIPVPIGTITSILLKKAVPIDFAVGYEQTAITITVVNYFTWALHGQAVDIYYRTYQTSWYHPATGQKGSRLPCSELYHVKV